MSIGSLYVFAAVESRRAAWDGDVPAAPRTGLRLAAVRQSFGATTRRDLDMGAIAEAFVAYAQPLLDQTDGSEEQLNKAFAISQLCYNLALLPDDERDTMLSEMRPDPRDG